MDEGGCLDEIIFNVSKLFKVLQVNRIAGTFMYDYRSQYGSNPTYNHATYY